MPSDSELEFLKPQVPHLGPKALNKRALNEVSVNSTVTERPLKKPSISQEMTRPGEDENGGTFVSHIPKPSSNLLQGLKNLTERNRMTSGIPTPVAPSTAGKGQINIQHINRLIGLKETLSKKSGVAESTGTRPTLRARVSQIEQTLASDIRRQKDIHEDVNSQLNELSEKAEDLEQELIELKRSMKKSSHALADISISINQLKRKFQYTEDSVMKNVEHKEQLINIQIQELSNTLSSQFNEIQFQLQHELQGAKSYRDDALLTDIDLLNRQRETLKNQLNETKIRKQQVIKSESSQLENELNKLLEPRVQEIEKMKEKYQQEVNSLATTLKDLETLQQEIQTKRKEQTLMHDTIEGYISKTNSFEDQKATLIKSLNDLESQLDSVKQALDIRNSDLKSALSTYNSMIKKKQKYELQKMKIENSIMNYEGKMRIYIKITEVNNKKEFYHEGKLYTFNQVVNASENLANDHLIRNFQALVESLLYGNNVSITYTGYRDDDLIAESICKSYMSLISAFRGHQKQTMTISLKCMEIKDSLEDLFDSNRIVSHLNLSTTLSQLNSQKMLIDNEDGLIKVIRDFATSSNIIYIMNVDIQYPELLKSFESNLMFLNLMSSDTLQQMKYLNGFVDTSGQNVISKLLRYAKQNSKTLLISNLAEKNKSYTSILQALETIKETACL